jgi:hypothetical protein
MDQQGHAGGVIGSKISDQISHITLAQNESGRRNLLRRPLVRTPTGKT